LQERRPENGRPPSTPARDRLGALLGKALRRRELSALVAAWRSSSFWVVAEPFRSWAAMGTVLYQRATIGLMAVSVSLLMIGGRSSTCHRALRS